MARAFDLAIIGSGPGGYVAAIRAAQLGMKVGVVERAELGGICANWGCIPTKALLRSAEVLELMRKASALGLRAENVGFDFGAVIQRSRGVADRQAKGVAYLFKKNRIEHVAGSARLDRERRIFVKPLSGSGSGNDEEEVTAKHVIVATGARPKTFPGAAGLTHDGDRVISYKEAMALPQQPASLCIIGAGAIGVEFAYFYATLGTKVTLVEALAQVLPVEDEEVAGALGKSLARAGIEILTGTKVDRIEKSADAVRVSVTDGKGQSRAITAERCLLAVGVVGNVEGFGLEEAGVKTERGFIAADRATYATSVDGIYAIGDVIGPPMLAHKASAEGIACVEQLAGYAHVHHVDYAAIPGCTYCKPEVASVGMTERQAKDARGAEHVKVGRFPLKASGKAMAQGDTEGFVKVVIDARHGELLGAHLLGGDATDLIAELVLAKTSELTAEEILSTVHAHPTLAETIKEAVGDAFGEAIDI